jgi:hypothetical protein
VIVKLSEMERFSFEAMEARRALTASTNAEQSWEGERITSKLAVRSLAVTLTTYLAILALSGRCLRLRSAVRAMVMRVTEGGEHESFDG